MSNTLLIDAPRNCSISDKGEEYIYRRMMTTFKDIDYVFALGKPRFEPKIVRRIAAYHRIDLYLKKLPIYNNKYFHRQCWELTNYHISNALFLFERGDWRIHAVLLHCLRTPMTIRGWDLDNDQGALFASRGGKLFSTSQGMGIQEIIPSWPRKEKKTKRKIPIQELSIFSK